MMSDEKPLAICSAAERVEAIYELIKDLDEDQMRNLAAEVDRQLLTRTAISDYVQNAVDREREQVELWLRKAVRNHVAGARHA